MKKVTTIGGGTGTFNVLSGLKKHPYDITAIVSVADSGGSTGRLRDEFGFLPVGDLRQSLAALADEDADHYWIRKILLYRFDNGNGLSGHNLGNLILTALQDMTGSTPKALEAAGQILRLKGKIYPSTTANVQLVIEYQDGEKVIGEHHITPKKHGGKKIKRISLTPKASVYSKAKQALLDSDFIIIGPGDLHDSILPNIIVKGLPEAVEQSSAKIIYIVNLMTRYTQTHNFTARDYVKEIKKYLGRYPDIVIVNDAPIPSNILSAYKKEHEYPVKNDLTNQPYQVIPAPLASVSSVKQKKSDAIRRSLLRHDREKLSDLLHRLITPKTTS